jgi:hypothetical protein
MGCFGEHSVPRTRWTATAVSRLASDDRPCRLGRWLHGLRSARREILSGRALANIAVNEDAVRSQTARHRSARVGAVQGGAVTAVLYCLTYNR